MICTIQGLVKRVLFTEDADTPPIDQYDLMVWAKSSPETSPYRRATDQELAQLEVILTRPMLLLALRDHKWRSTTPTNKAPVPAVSHRSRVPLARRFL